jgi:hypothetical protein
MKGFHFDKYNFFRRVLMLKKSTICLCFLIAFSGLFANGNVVKNGDFSNLNGKVFFQNWNPVDWKQLKGKSGIAKDTFKSAPYSLLIEHNSNDQFTLVSQWISLQKDKTYTISFWMKGEKIAATNKKFGAKFLILQKGGKIFRDGSIRGIWNPAQGTFGWTKGELEFKVSEFGKYNLLLCLNKATGKLWVDDVSIQEKKPLASTITATAIPIDYWQKVCNKYEYNIAANMPGILTFSFMANPAKVKKLEMIFDVPEGFEIIGATPRLANRIVNGKWYWKAEAMRTSEVKREGEKYTRYTIAVDKNTVRTIKKNSVAWGRNELVYMKCSSRIKKKSAIIYWKVRSDQISSKEHSFTANRLPAIDLSGRKLKKFKIMMTYLWSQYAPFSEVRNAYFAYWKSIAKRPIISDLFWWPHLSQELQGHLTDNFNIWPMIAGGKGTPRTLNNFPAWHKDAKTRIPGIKNIPLMMNDKQSVVSNMSVCPSYLIDDPGGYIWNKYIVETLKKRLKGIKKPETIFYDLEPGAYDACYDAKCIANFAKFAGLKTIPTIKTIKHKLRSQWFKFRLMQHAKIFANFKKSINRHFPGMKLYVATDPLHADGEMLSSWCGTDERMLDPFADGHMCMPYYIGKKFFDDIELNTRLLKKPVFPLIDPTEPVESFAIRYTPEGVEQNIVAAAALGCEGIGFWPIDCFDGLYLQSIIKTFRMVADTEDYYTKGKRVEKLVHVEATPLFQATLKDEGKNINIRFPNPNDLRYTVHRLAGNTLVTIFNYNKEKNIIVTLKASNAPLLSHIINPVTNNIYTDKHGRQITGKELRKGIMSLVKKSGVLQLEIKDGLASMKGVKTTSQKKFIDMIAPLKKSFASSTSFPTKKIKNASINWGDINADKIPELKLVSGNKKIYIDIAQSASIIGWKQEGNSSSDLLKHKSRGFFDQVNIPGKETERFHFNIKKMYFKNNAPCVVFEYTIPQRMDAGAEPDKLEGLFIRKTISLQENGNEIKIKWEFKNNSPRKTAMQFYLRLKNHPRLGARVAGRVPLGSIGNILLATKSGAKKINSSSPSNNLFLNKTNASHTFLNGKAVARDWLNKPIKVQAIDGKTEVENIIFEPSKSFAGVYIWWGNTYTIELLSPEYILNYGKVKTLSYKIKRK